MYCSEKGHRIRNCKKRNSDGRPKTMRKQQVQNVTLMVYTCSEDKDLENWYVDNGATTHITSGGDVFSKFEDFYSNHIVTTADGPLIPAKGKGSVEVGSNINGNKMKLTLSDVWYVPTLKSIFGFSSTRQAKREYIYIYHQEV